MNDSLNSIFAKFLIEEPLYSKVKIGNGREPQRINNASLLEFHDIPFKFKCPLEKEIQTFRTDFDECLLLEIKKANVSYIGMAPNSGPFPQDLWLNKNDGELITFQLFGRCQSCNEDIHYLINLESKLSTQKEQRVMDLYVEKIGQDPPYEISPDKIVEKYLSAEDSNLYKKALVNLSVGYGIGAFAYFRRVIENEIGRIITSISKLDFDGVEKVRAAIQKHKSDHQMSSLIEAVNLYLPKSLLFSNDNPLKLLYSQLSRGIHEYTEEECLKKAKMIDILLSYIIIKLNEEQYQITDVKKAMKSLRD